MNKERIKGFIIGIVLSTIFTIGATVAANSQQTVSYERLTYGVQVNLNGQLLDFDEDMRPFIMGSRTFLSVRAISEALGIEVDFEPITNTVYLGNRFAGQRLPLQNVAPFHERGGNFTMSSNLGIAQAWVSTHDTITMGGVAYTNGIRYATNFANHGAMSNSVFTLHNLGRQYRFLTGYVGRVDGSVMADATINIFGDGELLFTQNLRAGDLPVPISVFVEDVSLLRIEFVHTIATRPFWTALVSYGFVGFLE